VVAEITESNGSSSMATVCGGSLAMMDAGIPLKSPVSGIAMGLIKEGEKFVVLSDILGDEDYLGDMDFKVAGTANGVTALQMDIKVTGITFDIMKQALGQAHSGRMHILGEMSKTLSAARENLSDSAPIIKVIQINKDKIREVIGPGGKVIKDICEKTGAKVDINDEGKVQIAAVGSENLEKAVSMIMLIVSDPEVGHICDGKVVKVLESGAFVNYAPGKDGFVHISEIMEGRVENVSDHLQMDQVIKVKIIGIDSRGKVKLSMKLEANKDLNNDANSNDRPNKSEDSDNKRDDRSKHHTKRERIHKKPHTEERKDKVATERKYFN
jgi:polyribonucleotide nucleotidyltransferase